MDNLFEQFINERRYLRNLADSTLAVYRENYESFKKVGAFDNLSKASMQNAVMAFRQRGTSVGAINTYLRGVNCFLNWLHLEHGFEKLNMKLLKASKRVFRALTEAELRAIIQYKPRNGSERRLQTVLLLMIDTGLRVNECLTLDKRKIDFENLLLSVVGKGNKERIVPFSYELRKVLYKYVPSHPHELCSARGRAAKSLTTTSCGISICSSKGCELNPMERSMRSEGRLLQITLEMVAIRLYSSGC